MDTRVHTETHTPTFAAASLTTAGVRKAPQCPPTGERLNRKGSAPERTTAQQGGNELPTRTRHRLGVLLKGRSQIQRQGRVLMSNSSERKAVRTGCPEGEGRADTAFKGPRPLWKGPGTRLLQDRAGRLLADSAKGKGNTCSRKNLHRTFRAALFVTAPNSDQSRHP